MYACHAQKKRLPWRRFYLDKKDRGDESEEEIWAEEDGSSAVAAVTPTRTSKAAAAFAYQ